MAVFVIIYLQRSQRYGSLPLMDLMMAYHQTVKMCFDAGHDRPQHLQCTKTQWKGSVSCNSEVHKIQIEVKRQTHEN